MVVARAPRHTMECTPRSGEITIFRCRSVVFQSNLGTFHQTPVSEKVAEYRELYDRFSLIWR